MSGVYAETFTWDDAAAGFRPLFFARTLSRSSDCCCEACCRIEESMEKRAFKVMSFAMKTFLLFSCFVGTAHQAKPSQSWRRHTEGGKGGLRTSGVFSKCAP
jgi:hypothetical protein